MTGRVPNGGGCITHHITTKPSIRRNRFFFELVDQGEQCLGYIRSMEVLIILPTLNFKKTGMEYCILSGKEIP